MPQKQTSQEKPSAFKHWINETVVENMAQAISQVHKEFDATSFRKIARQLPSLELKARVQLLSDELQKHLPVDFAKSVSILLKSVESGDLKGFALWPYTDYIQKNGLAHSQKSLEALYQLTERFTGEFAVRPFLREATHETLAFLLNCARDTNVHVRRWSSEGSRPRLPWGEKLDVFIKNPKLTLPILEELKYDTELYVRKSVANHLNDIAKDHPKVTLDLLKTWNQKAPAEHREKIKWITRHALRTLIKKGHPEALKLMGVSQKLQAKVQQFKIQNSTARRGQKLEFEFVLASESKKSQKVILDYIIHYQKADGTLSPKVFKLKTFELRPLEKVAFKKTHSLKPITTRKYYPGSHRLELQINGHVVACKNWLLK